LHNKWRYESPYVNIRVNVRLCPELSCAWARKYFRVCKLRSISWVVWNNVRDLHSFWTIYNPLFLKSYETFLSSMYIYKMISWQFSEVFKKF
jgi:hypothetical protein